MDSSPGEAMEIADRVIRELEPGEADDLLGKAMIYLSRALSIKYGASRALKTARNAVKLISGSEYREELAMAFNNLGNCSRRNYDLSEALDSYIRSAQLYDEMGNIRGSAVVYNGMAQTYRRMGLYEKAYQFFKRSSQLGESVEYGLISAIALSNLADMLVGQRDYTTAESYLKRGLELNRRIGRELGVGFCLGSLGRLELARGNLDEAEGYFREAISIWEDIEYRSHLVESYCNLSEVLEKKSRKEEAGELLERSVEIAGQTIMDDNLGIAKARLVAFNYRNGRTVEVEQELQEVIENLEDTGDQGVEKVSALRTLSQFYEETSRYREALECSRRLYDLEKELIAHESQHDVVRLKLKEEFKRSEEQRIALEEQKKELEISNSKLQDALNKINKLRQLLPICAKCKKVRNDDGYWEQIEEYITKHSDTAFSHGLCPECRDELYPQLSKDSGKPSSE